MQKPGLKDKPPNTNAVLHRYTVKYLYKIKDYTTQCA